MRKEVFIIAEAGVNHNGSKELAFKLIDKAKEAGVDAIKFQTFKAEKVVSKYADKAAYQKASTGSGETQLEMVKKLELSFSDFIELKNYSNEVGILFLSTPFDDDSIDFLNDLGMEIFKIPSGEITNLPYLIKIAKLRKPVIISTGMSSLAEIEYALNVLKDNGCNDIKILHCNTEYPTPMEDVNLSAMKTIETAFKVEVGYSDHTDGIEIPIAAVAMGATIIEKHFTLDKNMEGPDHKASLEPSALKAMVDAIRNVEIALGNGIKSPSKSEMKNKKIARKSIVAAREIKEGEIFTEDNLTIKRPGNGISPIRWYEILGKVSNKNYVEDELIEV
ncbi:N-acetylneuraminate synthase [Clostridium intestinale]|uniref:N-acetylneuraminate synthase n=1 Tax=Clostridium intestinale TaxID=36845 RepID=UPI002DD63567|nr:N-acetylneuraminate synthase [Clostridium intestinale]WRY49790.1 N-acetylneuraminate synthase [Clostridium intestinale]